MVLALRIIFTILAVLCVGALIPVGAFFGWLFAMMCGFGAFLFFVCMLLCKQTMDAQQSQTATTTTESADNHDDKSADQDAKSK